MNDTTKTDYNPKVGDIFLLSWGYDQTNVNFFQVTRLSKGGVFVKEINCQSAGGEGFMCQNVTAVANSFKDKSQWCTPKGQAFCGNVETFRKINYNDSNDSVPYFTVRSRYYAFLWNGKPTYMSWYA